MDPMTLQNFQNEAGTLLVQLLVYLLIYGFAGFVIGRKLHHDRAWLAWIPGVNLGYYCSLAGRNWIECAWFMVPIAQLILWVACFRAIARRLELPEVLGWCMLLPVFDLIAIGLMAIFGTPGAAPRKRTLADAVGYVPLPEQRQMPSR